MGNSNNTAMRWMFILGGTGAIGRALCDVIDTSRYCVCPLDSKLGNVLDTSLNLADADIVINLAGVTQAGDLAEVNKDTNKTVMINCEGAVNTLSSCLPSMRRRGYGRIIMVSSVCSEINITGLGVYSASKAFVDKLVKIAAIENAHYGITVNSVQLGYMGIGLNERMTTDEFRKSENKSAMKRFCTIEELYQTIDYIIETEYLTGQNIRLDGGIR